MSTMLRSCSEPYVAITAPRPPVGAVICCEDGTPQAARRRRPLNRAARVAARSTPVLTDHATHLEACAARVNCRIRPRLARIVRPFESRPASPSYEGSPLMPRLRRPFYGWYLVAAGMVAQALSAGLLQ